jgi:hypothetical protein
MAGDRQLVREAVASYFGGTLVTTDSGICYQGGSLNAYGLGTAYPYLIKGGAPDQYYTEGMAPGTGWGAVMTVHLGPAEITRNRARGGSLGGPTSGFMGRWYTTRCDFDVISYELHLETAEAGLDNLIDAFLGLIYADRTLGSTNAGLYPNPPYFGNRLIMQAGQFPKYITVSDTLWYPAGGDRGKFTGGVSVTFECLTMIAA